MRVPVTSEYRRGRQRDDARGEPSADTPKLDVFNWLIGLISAILYSSLSSKP